MVVVVCQESKNISAALESFMQVMDGLSSSALKKLEHTNVVLYVVADKLLKAKHPFILRSGNKNIHKMTITPC